MKMALRISITVLAILGFIGVSKISYVHAIGESSCPMLGTLPACYLIFFAYGLIIISMLPKITKAKMIFTIGWLPVIVLALMGTVGELTQTMSCPHTETGIPKCYFSAAFSAVIGILAFFHFKVSKKV
jgi:hypothetical protein